MDQAPNKEDCVS